LLARRDRLPAGFLDASAPQLHRVLPEPTLLRLDGRAGAPLLVVVLQHGHEDTGLAAVQRMLRAHGDRPLPRPMWLFIANPQAARLASRRIPGGRDLNRCWPGTAEPACHETRLLTEVFETIVREPLFASIDLHNTTGASPYHVGINTLAPRTLQLASWYARTLVYFERPRGAQSLALTPYCPAVTLECGQPGAPAAVEHTRRFLAQCLASDSILSEAPAASAIDVYRSIARVVIAEGIAFDFGFEATAALALHPALDALNFRDLPAGSVLARTRTDKAPIRAIGADGVDRTADLFTWADGFLRLRRHLMPSLLSRDAQIVREDCLGQLMERIAP